MRAADLGVCAPSGTRTPNPLKLAERLPVALVIALIWPLTSTFAGLITLVLPALLGRFRADGGGVNRGSSFGSGRARRGWAVSAYYLTCRFPYDLTCRSVSAS